MQADFTDSKILEKYSSAFTISDMELFIFPELLYSLVLANIMSPVIWQWKHDPWFKEVDQMSPYKRILRIKQYIMDHYVFNLDLETWGLTTKETEIDRFKNYVDMELLKKSNALFGYEGDKYYFSINIRKHFGLDKYNDNVIPYWKTETVEAMNAFAHKENYKTGAGECVSLAALYAAAFFIVGKIPLEDIFLIGTPLHSQNFILLNDGILTNNRRIVTKNMWTNGTELSAKARRALENEVVTVVAHSSGYVHVFYDEYTILADSYKIFQKKLASFLQEDFSSDLLINFLRCYPEYRSCFQFRYLISGKRRYIGAEKLYHYEHGSKFAVNKTTRRRLLEDIEEDEFFAQPIEKKIVIEDLEDFIDGRKLSLDNSADRKLLEDQFCSKAQKSEEMMKTLQKFARTVPRLPQIETKKNKRGMALEISSSLTRQEIIEYLKEQRKINSVADLAFYVYRDLNSIDWRPLFKAVLERNPVSVSAVQSFTIDQIVDKISKLPNISIYSKGRVALPDEVWNYQRGDGLEKALLLGNILKFRKKHQKISINVSENRVVLQTENKKYFFKTLFEFKKNIKI